MNEEEKKNKGKKSLVLCLTVQMQNLFITIQPYICDREVKCREVGKHFKAFTVSLCVLAEGHKKKATKHSA